MWKAVIGGNRGHTSPEPSVATEETGSAGKGDVPLTGEARDAAQGDPGMSRAEVQRKALRGVALVGVRGLGIRVVGVTSTIALARLLTPHDFGLIALGMAVVGLTQFADGGIAAGLIRSRQEPDRADLASMEGLQLLLTTAFAAVIASVGLNFGMGGRFVALVSLALPITALRAPSFVALERNLSYRPLAVSETLEWVAYYACGLPLVVLGAGVWGMGIGMIARVATGTGVMLFLTPGGRVWPSLRLARVRRFLHFGVRFQGILLAEASREQGISFGILLIANAAVLGTWSLVVRIMQVPFLLQYSLRRVSYPAMSRLLATDTDPGPSLERGARAVAVVSGLILAGLIGSGPALIPVVFGNPWRSAVPLLPWVGMALAIAGPVMVISEGYLFAYGDVTKVFRAVMADSLACLAITFSLLPVVGIQAIGMGMLAGRLVGSFMLNAAGRRLAGARVMLATFPAITMTAVASAAGWAAARGLGPRFTTIVVSGAIAGILYVLGETLIDRQGVRDAIRFTRRSLGREAAVAG
jgi:O-antigen/teichoic acid export membrane protein